MQSARLHPVAKALALACNQLHRAGLVPGLSGQFSAWDEDLLWMTPPGRSFRDIQPEHLLLVCPDNRLIGTDSDGFAAQLALHQAIYQARPDAKAVLIANPPNAGKLTAAQAGQPLPPEGVPIPLGRVGSVRLLPAQSDETRLDGAKRVFQADSAMVEVGFGMMIAANSMTDAVNRVEELEAAMTAEWAAYRMTS
jgi:ribulose-5-phosphate 4-epimerase/fuculose-1-phosphate aldolase